MADIEDLNSASSLDTVELANQQSGDDEDTKASVSKVVVHRDNRHDSEISLSKADLEEGLVSNLVRARQQMEFDFMRRDTRPLVPLQDWSDYHWAQQLAKYPGKAEVFLKNFLVDDTLVGYNERYANGYELAAQAVRVRMNQPLLKEEWIRVLRFQSLSTRSQECRTHHVYMPASMRAHIMFDREFPLGVDPVVLSKKNREDFALGHSGVSRILHTNNKLISTLVYLMVIGGVCLTILLLMIYTQSDEWNLEATKTDRLMPGFGVAVILPFVLCRFATLAFSLTVNASIDKFGKIDPSTSTVFIGMTLGNTIGFMLDNMIGSDEGFREYLWSTTGGMVYAVGSLATARFARYLVTILFDMFFTVIIFKRLYSKIVRLPGFSNRGREWIANGLSSTAISFLTFQVYANMTRLEWAYPSGAEDDSNPWISGATMILAVVTMNIVYLVDESRSSYGEKGINDPGIKIWVTLFTFALLAGLQKYGVADPSVTVVSNSTYTPEEEEAFMNEILPLKGVCETNKKFGTGFAILVFIVVWCLGFVIFVTSQQSTAGLFEECGEKKIKLFLFLVYLLCVIGILAFFTVVPLWSSGRDRDIIACP